GAVQQRVEERVGGLAERRDDAAPGDDDLDHQAGAPSAASSWTSATASPTVLIAFRRPSAIATPKRSSSALTSSTRSSESTSRSCHVWFSLASIAPGTLMA